MKVLIRDHAALSSISIAYLRAYLDSRGWDDIGRWGKRPVTVFATEHDGRTWEILVPHWDTLGGYAENMAVSIDVLSTVEGRSQLDVYYDLASAGADTIRVRSANGKTESSLSLRQSRDLLTDAYGMVAAAARAAYKPAPTYRGPMSSEVSEYLDSVKPAPIPRPGYALTLHSPVPAGLGTQADLGDDFLPPFPRLATLKLAEALKRSGEAISDAVANHSMTPFSEAVPHGVSANLCDSVAELVKKGDGVEIDLNWADTRPSSGPDGHFTFSQHSADVLSEAARHFRLNAPILNESVVAQVVKLEREPEEFDGRATLLYVSEDRPVRLRVEFDAPSYSTVIQAHEKRIPVRLDGDIYRVGTGHELRNPRNLILLVEDDD